MIRFFLEYENLVVQLPVNPEKLTVRIPGNNKTTEVIKLGEINLLRDTKLTEINIESFFPQNDSPPYVLTKGKFEGPQFYIDFIARARGGKKPLRLVISDTKVNMLVAIENFEHTLKAQDDDVHYSLTLKEYRPHNARVIVPNPATKTGGVTLTVERIKKGFAIGDEVIANGKYWASSYGDGPSGTFNNFVGRISHIVADRSRKYRYHITTLSGGYRGWVSDTQLKIK